MNGTNHNRHGNASQHYKNAYSSSYVNKYKWVSKEFQNRSRCQPKSTSHQASTLKFVKKVRKDETANKISIQCSKMIERLNNAAKTISDFTRSASTPTSSSEMKGKMLLNSKTGINPNLKTNYCRRCGVVSSRNPYHYFKCRCQSPKMLRSQRMPASSVKVKENDLSLKFDDKTNRQTEKEDKSMIPETSTKSTVVSSGDSVAPLTSHTQAVKPELKRNFIVTKYKVDRRTNILVNQSGLQRAKRFECISNRSKMDTNKMKSRTRSRSSSLVFKNRYAFDRRPRSVMSPTYRLSNDNRLSTSNTSVICGNSYKLVANIRRQVLRQQGFIVSNFKMRRKSWTQNASHVKRLSNNHITTKKSVFTYTHQRGSYPDTPTNRQRFYKQAIDRAKYRLINRKKMYCIQFIRNGKCKNRTVCKLLHDRNTVRLCPRFLNGSCDVESCCLSHSHDRNRLPFCRYFENGVCSRGLDCPFQHVKLPLSTPICVDFQWSYCPRGTKCHHRHVLGSRSFVRRQPKAPTVESSGSSRAKRLESDSFLPLLSDSDDDDDQSEREDE